MKVFGELLGDWANGGYVDGLLTCDELVLVFGDAVLF